jgi:hypothetical protein
MIIVDTWKVWSKITVKGPAEKPEPVETQKEFYSWLAQELINNTFDFVVSRSGGGGGVGNENVNNHIGIASMIDSRTNLPRSGAGPHLTPTKRKREVADQVFSFQGRCKVCGKKTTKECSKCIDNNGGKDGYFICNTHKGSMCFLEHCEEYHKNEM